MSVLSELHREAIATRELEDKNETEIILLGMGFLLFKP